MFSAVQKYYKQEVNLVNIPIGKDNFPNLLSKAQTKAFSKENIASGFRAMGIWPYDPAVILEKLFLPEPYINHTIKPGPPPIDPNQQTTYDLLSYRPQTPTTPKSIHTLYVEALATITSNSPRSVKQRSIFTKFKMGAETCAARAVMHEMGEEHLRNEIKELSAKSKPDKRRLNTTEACVLERGEVLVELKRRRDEADEKNSTKQNSSKAKRVRKKSPPQASQSLPSNPTLPEDFNDSIEAFQVPEMLTDFSEHAFNLYPVRPYHPFQSPTTTSQTFQSNSTQDELHNYYLDSSRPSQTYLDSASTLIAAQALP